jgi:hypothetical protein
VAVLFVLQGGPDLALTQFLVETLTLVLFVFVLRRLPSSFTPRRLRLSQATRIAIALSVGVVVTAAVLVAGQARTAPPASQAYLDRALPEGGGSNVVNVVLVDFRWLRHPRRDHRARRRRRWGSGAWSWPAGAPGRRARACRLAPQDAPQDQPEPEQVPR